MKLRFILSEVGKGLSRNRAMSVAVVIVTFVSLPFADAGLANEESVVRQDRGVDLHVCQQ